MESFRASRAKGRATARRPEAIRSPPAPARRQAGRPRGDAVARAVEGPGGACGGLWLVAASAASRAGRVVSQRVTAEPCLTRCEHDRANDAGRVCRAVARPRRARQFPIAFRPGATAAAALRRRLRRPPRATRRGQQPDHFAPARSIADTASTSSQGRAVPRDRNIAPPRPDRSARPEAFRGRPIARVAAATPRSSRSVFDFFSQSRVQTFGRRRGDVGAFEPEPHAGRSRVWRRSQRWRKGTKRDRKDLAGGAGLVALSADFAAFLASVWTSSWRLPFAFLQRHQAIDLAARESLFGSAGPANANLVDFVSFTQSKVSPRLVAALVARAGIDQPLPGALARRHGDDRAVGVATQCRIDRANQ